MNIFDIDTSKYTLKDIMKSLTWALFLSQNVEGSSTPFVQAIGRAVEIGRDLENGKEAVPVDLIGEEVKKFLETTMNDNWQMPFTALTPEYCKNCPTHPNNGGDGICHCTLGYQVRC